MVIGRVEGDRPEVGEDFELPPADRASAPCFTVVFGEVVGSLYVWLRTGLRERVGG